MKTALITGITGQDGSYLTELLLEKGYVVHGLVRRASIFNRSRIDHLRTRPNGQDKSLLLHYGELNDPTSLRRLLEKVRPQEVYHLAGQSHVGLSFEIPEVTCHENAMATLALLEALRDLDYPARFYHASSSEVFGVPKITPQDETTLFNPINPYGVAKAFATQMARVYRQAYGLYAVNGISYNHESPRRGENFVTRKITMAAASIRAGTQSILLLGNLDARRDWGYAKEYVEAMWRSLQVPAAEDYIFATGRLTSVREFAVAAFAAAGIAITFEGHGENEVGRCIETGAVIVQVSPRLFRPADSMSLLGNASRAAQQLAWRAEVSGADLAALMVRAEQAPPRPEMDR